MRADATSGGGAAVLTPLLVLNIAIPIAAVLQFRAIALLATLGFVAVLAIFRVQSRRWPLPSGALLWAAGALGLLAALSAVWAPDPLRAFGTGARFIAFVALACAVARCMAEQSVQSLARLERTLLLGVLSAAALALADHLSGNAIRATVRGLQEWDATLGFGLKPAVSVLVVLLPLVLTLPQIALSLRLLAGLLVVATAAILPAESAKIAGAAALGVFFVQRVPWMRPLVRGSIPILAALLILALPLALAALLAAAPALEAMPRTAAHRVLIWSFVIENIEIRPLLGWGAESSRLIPGGTELFSRSVLNHFGLISEQAQAWFAMPSAQRLPLHPHSAALQLWLELGGIGAIVAAVLVWLIGRRAAGLRVVSAGAIAAFVAAVLIASLSYGVWQEWWIGFLLFAALNAYGLHLGALGAARRQEARDNALR